MRVDFGQLPPTEVEGSRAGDAVMAIGAGDGIRTPMMSRIRSERLTISSRPVVPY